MAAEKMAFAESARRHQRAWQAHRNIKASRGIMAAASAASAAARWRSPVKISGAYGIAESQRMASHQRNIINHGLAKAAAAMAT